jgi:hypothetical protein
MPGLVTRGYGTDGPLVTRGLGFGPVPPGLLLPVSWFLVLQPGGVLGSAALGPFRDDDAFIGSDIADSATSIVGLLEATGEFDRVNYGSGPDDDRSTSQMGRVAVITPDPRARMAGQPSPKRRVRQATYTLTVKYRVEEVADKRAEADRLFAVCHNVLEGVSYGGFTLFEDSMLTDDIYDDSRHPEIRLTMRGMFSYVVNFSSHGVKLRTTS